MVNHTQSTMGLVLTMLQEAIQDAGITKEQIDAALFHGTGTVPGEVYDWTVWRDIYGLEPKTYKENFHDEPDINIEEVPDVTLPKASYGHTLAASGVLSSFTIFDIFKRQEVPATRNITKPHGLTVNLVHGENKKKEVNICIVTAAGIEGTVAAVIYKRPPDEIPSYPQA